MENFCQRGKLEIKNDYEVCRGVDAKNGLRYDLTLLRPSSQTAGHYHFGIEPELYEVQSGRAQFLIQSRDAQKTYLIETEEKERVVIPPDFSMRTINPSKEKELLISNWVSDKIKNDYNAFKNLQEPIKLRPKKLPQELENLEFLNNPEKYANILTIENLYERIQPR
ncbi:MAG: hypothetical protein HY773_00995 [Candidatus Terrybacteria bacterium]|nr:hypothetical protein [Candidatus Terrybacteria bacterium]